MDITQIAIWLKSSVLGVIILGAIGSLLSILLIKAFLFTKSLVGKSTEAYKKRNYGRGIQVGIITGYLLYKKDSELAIAYLVSKVSKLLLILFLILASFIVFLYLIETHVGIFLSLTSFITVVVFFLSSYFTFEEYRDIKALYNKLYEERVSPFMDDVIKKQLTSSSSGTTEQQVAP